jgi:RimJ/RimL family protein N-acetyltransferase
MKTLEPITLAGQFVRLEPHADHHRSALQAAANDPSLWTITARLGHAEHFDGWWQEHQKSMLAKTALPFVVILQATSAIVGSTSLMNVALPDDRLEIGSTWYQRTHQGTAVNPECKLLLMQHAFETLGIKRVEFCVDAINAHSRAAVLKMGATQEGILRSHRYTQTGRRRDTVIFSILDSEWPTVKASLASRLGSPLPPGERG